MTTSTTDTPGAAMTTIVIGPESTGPDPASLPADCTLLFLDWKAWALFAEDNPQLPSRFVELDEMRRDIEARAFDWAGLAAQALVAHCGGDDALYRATRRILQHGVGFKAAAALSRANAIADMASSSRAIELRGVDALTSAFLRLRARADGVELTGAVEVPRPTLMPGTSVPVARAVAGTLRFARNAPKRRRNTQAVSTAVAASDQPAVGFIAQALRDEPIVGPSLAELRRQGRPVIKIDLSPDARMLGTDLECEAAVDGRVWVDAYPLDCVARLMTARRSAMREIAKALPAEVGPASELLAATACAVGLVTAPALLRTSGRIIEALQPERLVVLGETNRIVEPLALAARSRNVPVTCVQHGIIHDIPQWAQMPYSTFAVYGPAYREVLASLGTPAEHIAVTGDPRLDRTAKAEPKPREEVLASLGIAEGELAGMRIVLFASNYTTHRLSGASMERAFEALATAVEQLDDAMLLVKLHPNGAGRELPYERVLARHPQLPHLVAPRPVDLIDTLSISDVVTVHVSSVGFEAAALHKPLVVVRTDTGILEVPFTREGVAFEAHDAEELRHTLREILDGQLGAPAGDVLAQFNARYNMLDGASTARLASAIAESSW